MGHEDAVMFILDHHDTISRTQRVVAVNMTLRGWGERKQLLQHLLGGRQMRSNGSNPAFDRRFGKRNQEQRGKEERNVPEADPTDHRQVAGQPDHAVAHVLGGRDALDLWGEVPASVRGIEVGTLRYDESVGNRVVKRRQFMHIDVIGFLPPTEPGLRPQFLLKVVLAQIKRDNRRAVFHRRAHKGVLVHFCDSRRKLHLHGYCHLASFATPDYRIRDGEDSSMTARGVRLMVDLMSRKDRFKMLCVEPGTHPEKYIDHLKHTQPDVQPDSVESLRKRSKVLIKEHLQVDGLAADCGVLT